MRRPLLALALLPFLYAVAASAQQTVQLDAAAMNRAGVLVRPVLERPFGEQVAIVGEVVRAPGTTLTVKTPVESRVLESLVAPGDRVRTGDPLLVIHSHDVHSLQGEVLRLRDEALLARSRQQAGERLYALEGISRIDLEQRIQQAMAAGIRYEVALHELEDLGFDAESIEGLLERGKADGLLTLRAMSDGVVLELTVQRHQWTQAFEPLLVMGDPGRLELEVRIPPADASRVAMGDRVDFVPVGRPEAASRARVLTPIPRVDRISRTLTVRAEILEAPEALFPGVFVEGLLTHGEARSSLSVPESAVIRVGGNDHVFVKGGRPGLFEARPVELGSFNGTRYEVLLGLRQGEEVAVRGVFLLKSALLQGGGEE
jgi:cobalt-zinc-cadmium efflux system membrane fusion protein